jgi:hypothetical protein
MCLQKRDQNDDPATKQARRFALRPVPPRMSGKKRRALVTILAGLLFLPMLGGAIAGIMGEPAGWWVFGIAAFPVLVEALIQYTEWTIDTADDEEPKGKRKRKPKRKNEP